MQRIVIMNLHLFEVKTHNRLTLNFVKRVCMYYSALFMGIYPRDMGIVPAPSVFKVPFFKQTISINLLSQKEVFVV